MIILKVLRSILIYILHGKCLVANRSWRDYKSGGEVFILANGPSLGNINAERLYGRDCITMNNFNKCAWKDEVNIVAHCIGEPRQSRHWGVDQLEIMNEINADSYWLDYSVKRDADNWDNNINVNYVMATLSEDIPFMNKINLCRPTLGFSTTAQMAIMVAVFMGYKNIKLLGFDHDMLANRNVSAHFYQDDQSVRVVDYTETPYIDIIKRTLTMWKRYIVLKKIASKSGVKITNCTHNSYLDVFENGK